MWAEYIVNIIVYLNIKKKRARISCQRHSFTKPSSRVSKELVLLLGAILKRIMQNNIHLQKYSPELTDYTIRDRGGVHNMYM